MKKILILFLFTLCLQDTITAQINWISDFETAQKLSVVKNKPILIDFWASWCMPCKKMDEEVWSKEEIVELSKNFIPLKIDVDLHHALMMNYGVDGIPYFFITDSPGNVLYKNKGFANEHDVHYILERYAINLGYLQGAVLQYYQKRNYITTLRLANKYLDYSLLVNKIIKSDVLDLADHYLMESEKLLDKEQENYVFMAQKIELLQTVIDLYAERYDKVERYLNRKIDVSDLKAQNRILYAYLNYCTSCKKGETAEMDKWKNHLKNSRSGDLYLSRAEKLLEID